jgi:manganese efflux pump family protein
VTKLLLLVVPLGLDTFAVAAALGLRPMPRRERVRVGGVIAAFEMAMPIVGLFVGRGIGGALGGIAEAVAAGLLITIGFWMVAGDEDALVPEPRELRGLPLVLLGLSVSLDELALGIVLGLVGVPVVAAVVLLGVQAFAFSQLGFALGARMGARLREGAERVAGLALVGLGAVLLIGQVTG